MAIGIIDRMLAQELGLILGVREILDIRHSLFGHKDHDPDFETLYAFEVKTNQLPVGHDRQEWEPAALAEKDKEIATVEAASRSEILDACRSLRAKFAGNAA